MSCLNKASVEQLVQESLQFKELKAHFDVFNEKYSKKIILEPHRDIIKKVNRINEVFNQNLKTNSNLELPCDDKQNKLPCFFFGELKVFIWVVVVYCGLRKIALEDLTEDHYQDLQKIFLNKSLLFIKYEIQCLMHDRIQIKKAPIWSKEERILLVKIVTEKKAVNEWKQISYELYRSSECRFYRHFQECREMWYNHMDRNVNRGQWTPEEDIKLLQEAEIFQRKWANIFEEFGGKRTQHMIKNRYNSLIQRYKKMFNQKNVSKVICKAIRDLKQQVKEEKLKNEELIKAEEEVFKVQEIQTLLKYQTHGENKDENELKLSFNVMSSINKKKKPQEQFFTSITGQCEFHQAEVIHKNQDCRHTADCQELSSIMPEIKEVENFDFQRYNSYESQKYLIDISLWAEPSRIFDDIYESNFENEFFDGYNC